MAAANRARDPRKTTQREASHRKFAIRVSARFTRRGRRVRGH